MSNWNRVSQLDIPIGPEFRPLNDEEKREFITSANAASEKLDGESVAKLLLPLVKRPTATTSAASTPVS